MLLARHDQALIDLGRKNPPWLLKDKRHKQRQYTQACAVLDFRLVIQAGCKLNARAVWLNLGCMVGGPLTWLQTMQLSPVGLFCPWEPCESTGYSTPIHTCAAHNICSEPSGGSPLEQPNEHRCSVSQRPQMLLMACSRRRSGLAIRCAFCETF